MSAHSFRNQFIRSQIILKNRLKEIDQNISNVDDDDDNDIKDELRSDTDDGESAFLEITIQDNKRDETDDEFSAALAAEPLAPIQEYECPLCHIKLKSKYKWKRHMRTEHANIKVPNAWNDTVICEICGLEMKAEKIRMHRKYKHTNDRPHVCDICGRRFVEKFELKKHMYLMHINRTPTKTFSCSMCPKVVQKQASLRKHIFFCHTDEGRPFRCSICEMRFKFEPRYRLHMDMHERQRNRHCHLCDRKYTSDSGLKAHLMKVHNTKKSHAIYQCSTSQ